MRWSLWTRTMHPPEASIGWTWRCCCCRCRAASLVEEDDRRCAAVETKDIRCEIEEPHMTYNWSRWLQWPYSRSSSAETKTHGYRRETRTVCLRDTLLDVGDGSIPILGIVRRKNGFGAVTRANATYIVGTKYPLVVQNLWQNWRMILVRKPSTRKQPTHLDDNIPRSDAEGDQSTDMAGNLSLCFVLL